MGERSSAGLEGRCLQRPGAASDSPSKDFDQDNEDRYMCG
jgi:hypothetical protein